MSEKKIIIITGISSGIGFYLSYFLSKKNFLVYGILRDKIKYQQSLEKEKWEYPKNLILLETDVRNYSKIDEIIQSIGSKDKRIDILINNAGYGLYGAFEELSEKDFREQFETNFFAPMYLIKKVIPIMRKQQNGKIINITSILGKVTIPTASAYCSSKHALVALSEVLHYELSSFGIQVCSVEPGLIQTNFKQNMKFSVNLDNSNSPYFGFNQIIKKELQKYPRYAISASKAAQKILDLIEREKIPLHYEMGIDAKIASHIKTFFPHFIKDALIREFLKNKIKA